MIIPVRCFTCGKVIGDKWEIFKERIKQENEDPNIILDDLKLTRYCCRRMLLTYMNLLEDISKFRTLG
ncbi:MAG: DNA-directed RNA polymerase subunit N [Promethearchaeota archaeon]